MQDKPRAISEIGSTLLTGTYRILGITGCACSVIPDHKIVAVWMYNLAELTRRAMTIWRISGRLAIRFWRVVF